MRKLLPFLLVVVAVAPLRSTSRADSESLVYINGALTQVRFNDGDSFRQLNGRYSGRGSRLAGFNTLESYGPAHQWTGWHPYELYLLAKQATASARQGIWHCTTDGSPDTYGRLLLDCPDLAISHIRQGFAHAMQIDDTPARPEYLRAQLEAQRARRGMWARGVPGFILTSTHSRMEDPMQAEHSNRMVSTRDGHSERWTHSDTYGECEWVCAKELRADEAAVARVVHDIAQDANFAPHRAGLQQVLLLESVERFARLGSLPAYLTPEASAFLTTRLTALQARGALGQTTEVDGACMLYVDFRRRFGLNRAACMHGHGNLPGGEEH